MKNEEVLQRFKAEGNITLGINCRKVKWTGHRFRRNCLPKRLIEGEI
jgi:ribosomal protein L24E